MKEKLIEFIYLIISSVFWLLSGAGLFFRCRKIILCYHGVNDKQKSGFEKQMRLLAWLQKNSFFRKEILLTFDDGFRNLMDNAIPLLNELKIHSIVFIVTGNMGKAPSWEIDADHVEYGARLMSEEEMLEVVSNNPVSIGSHTHTHVKLGGKKSKEIRSELELSKKRLESLLGETVSEIAMPHGSCSDEVVDIAVELGYEKIYTLEHKLNSLNRRSIQNGRFVVVPETSLLKFFLVCSGSYFWLYYFRKAVNLIRQNRKIQ